MARLERMAQRHAFDRLRQHPEEGFEILGIEGLAGRQLPDDRPQLVTQLGDAALDEALDRFPRLAQLAPLRRIARGLEAEDEALGRVVAPLREAAALLRAVVRAVDLDGTEPAAGVGQLAAVREARRVEVVAPGLEVPAADAHADRACLSHAILLRPCPRPRFAEISPPWRPKPSPPQPTSSSRCRSAWRTRPASCRSGWRLATRAAP